MSSRSPTPAETRYSNIERECLAVQWGLERFEYYLLGRHVKIETDHAPLEQIFKKSIAESPARLQRLLLRCMKFDINVQYRPGRSIPVADALSRICTGSKNKNDATTKSDVSFTQHALMVAMLVKKHAKSTSLKVSSMTSAVKRLKWRRRKTRHTTC